MKLLESDNFFHCKANYEAAKQGLWGEIVAKIISLSREVWGLAGGDPLSDSMRDWNANQMGWDGAKEGLNLQEACPTDPKVYYNPKWYQKF